MKTKTNTLNVAHSDHAAVDWLNQRNYLLSEISEKDVKNYHFLFALMFAFFATIALLLASDWCQFYGWSAFFSLAAVNVALPIVSLFKERR